MGELPKMADTPEKKERLRVPSARIAVSLLDDEDALILMNLGRCGIYALWAFTGLLILSKTFKNKGHFRGPSAKYARRIGLTPAQLEEAITEIEAAAKENDHEPWIVRDGDDFRIRQWHKWNHSDAGGPRDGAGRKPQGKSKRNQSGIKSDSKVDSNSESKSGPPVSSSVSSSSPESRKGDTPLPPSLDCEEFRVVWAVWGQHRREKRAKLTPTAAGKQLAQLAEWGVARAIAALEHTMRQGWTGIFEPDAALKATGKTPVGDLRAMFDKEPTNA